MGMSKLGLLIARDFLPLYWHSLGYVRVLPTSEKRAMWCQFLLVLTQTQYVSIINAYDWSVVTQWHNSLSLDSLRLSLSPRVTTYWYNWVNLTLVLPYHRTESCPSWLVPPHHRIGSYHTDRCCTTVELSHTIAGYQTFALASPADHVWSNGTFCVSDTHPFLPWQKCMG